MDRMTVDQALERVQLRLHLSKEAEREILDEIRSHLEAALADASARGEDEQLALRKAAEQFGGDEVGLELQEVHAGWETMEAVAVTALPVLFTLILRWLVFAPDGAALAWHQLLARPGFWIVAASALLIPVIWFHRWRMALAGWAFFWLLTVIFVIFPAIRP